MTFETPPSRSGRTPEERLTAIAEFVLEKVKYLEKEAKASSEELDATVETDSIKGASNRAIADSIRAGEIRALEQVADILTQ